MKFPGGEEREEGQETAALGADQRQAGRRHLGRGRARFEPEVAAVLAHLHDSILH